MNQEIKRIKELLYKLEQLTDDFDVNADIPIKTLQEFKNEFEIIAGNFESLAKYLENKYKP